VLRTRTEYLTFHTKERMAIVNITAQIVDIVRKSGVRDGACLINAMHTTSSVLVSDDENGLRADLLKFLELIHAQDRSGRAGRTGVLDPHHDNMDAHLLHHVFGRDVLVAVTDYRLDLGPWEQVYYGEFDGMRPKRVLVKAFGV